MTSSQKNTPLPNGFVEFLREVAKETAVKKIVLFGSRATGRFKERSDIDLTFFSEEISTKEWSFLVNEIENNSITLLNVDMIHFEKIKDTNFQKRILSEARILYTVSKK